MSQENVEIVHRSAEAFARDADILWEETPSLGPDASTEKGVAELRGRPKPGCRSGRSNGFEVRRYADFGDEVVVLAHEQGQVA